MPTTSPAAPPAQLSSAASTRNWSRTCRAGKTGYEGRGAGEGRQLASFPSHACLRSLVSTHAVSRRIQALESDLGVPLFQRKHRALASTHAGQAYFSNLEPAIDNIRRASHRLRVGERSRSVKVNLPATLAANWLLPRLQQFHDMYRGVRIELESNSEHCELESASEHSELKEGKADLAIQLGNGSWPGLRSARLLDLEGFPVCSPSFRVPDGASTLEGLGELPLLGIRGQPELWPEWFHSAGLPQPLRVHQEFDSVHLLYRAAACGLGIALGVDVLVQPYLDDGQLVRPFNSQYRLSNSYYVICRTTDISRRPVCTFRDWLLAQAGGATSRP